MNQSHHTPTARLAKTKIHLRRLKVRKTHHSYQLNQADSERTPIAEIHLKGHWLIDAGFDIDRPVKIRVFPGCLVLTTQSTEGLQQQFEQLSKKEQQLISQTIASLLDRKSA